MGDKHGNLPIHYAAVRGQVTCVQLFLKEANVPGETRWRDGAHLSTL